MTRILLLKCCCANLSASADVSFEPSSTTTSSNVRARRMWAELRCVNIFSSMDGQETEIESHGTPEDDYYFRTPAMMPSEN
jgi:hypothetical protein